MSAMKPEISWWRSGVLYQIYPRSFADSNGDGIGDLGGVIDRLDHLAWLGVDGIWLSPITPSPNADWGYDVADYCAVAPEYGTLADLDRLIEEARRRGIRVVMDLVPNHTSERHPWFLEARSSRTAKRRDWYVWADPKPDGSPPNNWVSNFGGPAWTFDAATGQFYLHNFTPSQPDLNWWNAEVRRAFEEIHRFWYARGVAGFRIDVCHAMIKDAELRDTPPAGDDSPYFERLLGLRQVYNANRPEAHDILRSWRRIADSYDPPRLLLGETYVHDPAAMARFYGAGDDELHLALNVPFQEVLFEASALRGIVERTESLLPPGAWPLWHAGNHDVSRMASRWAEGDPAKVRLAILLLLTLRGTPLLYQGDELGLPDTPLGREDIVDPVGVFFWPAHPGRDPVRTPMPWDDTPGGGFTAPGVRPWLPFGDLTAHNVRAQRDDPLSPLRLTRDLIALRRRSDDLWLGAYAPLAGPPGTWSWRRGEATIVALNLSPEPASLEMPPGRIEIGTDRARDGELAPGRIELRPWEGVLMTAHTPPQGVGRKPGG